MLRFSGGWKALVFVLVLAGLAFTLAFRARSSSANGDARLSLLMSLAIIEHGTIRLDPYVGRVTPPLASSENDARLFFQEERIYYAFPVGSPLLAVPAVWAARLIGRDLTIVAEQNRIQNGLSAITVALTLLGVYALARVYLPVRDSMLVTMVSVYGSMLMSTLGTALWSFNFTVLAMLVVLWMLAAYERGVIRSLRPWLIGLLLFIAYLCRPSAAVFTVGVLIYLFFRKRRAAVTAGGIAFILMIGFAAFSWHEFGTVLPPYYDPERLQHFTNISPWTGLLGLLLSPSRGLLVYCPYLLVTGAVLIARWRRWRSEPLFWLAAAWPAVQVIVLLRATRWWGGWSFGPRVMTDLFPALILLIILSWRWAVVGASEGWRPRLYAGSFAILGAFAVWIHTGQGLYNVNTSRWNGAVPPNVDQYPEYLFDWEYPQFLATAASLCARNAEFLQNELEAAPLPVVSADLSLAFDAPEAAFEGWSLPEPEIGMRWSECEKAAVLLRVDFEPAVDYLVSFEIAGLATERVDVLLNGVPIGTIHPTNEAIPEWVQLPTRGSLWRDEAVNRITFVVPDAGTPVADRPYREGIGLAAIGIKPLLPDSH